MTTLVSILLTVLIIAVVLIILLMVSFATYLKKYDTVMKRINQGKVAGKKRSKK